jgi:hypothetical protein
MYHIIYIIFLFVTATVPAMPKHIDDWLKTVRRRFFINRISLVSLFVTQIPDSLSRCWIICPFNVPHSCWNDSEREVALWRLGVFVASSMKAFKGNCWLQACWYEINHSVFSCVCVPREDAWWTEWHRWGGYSCSVNHRTCNVSPLLKSATGRTILQGFTVAVHIPPLRNWRSSVWNISSCVFRFIEHTVAETVIECQLFCMGPLRATVTQIPL